MVVTVDNSHRSILFLYLLPFVFDVERESGLKEFPQRPSLNNTIRDFKRNVQVGLVRYPLKIGFLLLLTKLIYHYLSELRKTTACKLQTMFASNRDMLLLKAHATREQSNENQIDHEAYRSPSELDLEQAVYEFECECNLQHTAREEEKSKIK